MKNGILEIDPHGNKHWRLNGKFHRLDGPAFIGIYGTKSWWINGRRHRLDGHAYISNNGHKEWWIKGIKYTEYEFNNRILTRWRKLFI